MRAGNGFCNQCAHWWKKQFHKAASRPKSEGFRRAQETAFRRVERRASGFRRNRQRAARNPKDFRRAQETAFRRAERRVSGFRRNRQRAARKPKDSGERRKPRSDERRVSGFRRNRQRAARNPKDSGERRSHAEKSRKADFLRNRRAKEPPFHALKDTKEISAQLQ